ncbi:MAG: hypothetical protein IT452_05455 [Planctomycetia bacterium]|nr:hypothetical protein [Planctomycetia bacterium]
MRALPLLAAALALLSALPSHAADCDACMAPATLCVRHRKEQDEALKAFGKLKRDKDPMKRREGLDLIGKLNDEHRNARDPELAKAVADMLDDADSGLRLGALGYLRQNQEVQTAREEIAKMFEKLLPKIGKPKPDASSKTAGKLAIEWENSLAFCKEAIGALVDLGGKESEAALVKAIGSENLAFLSDIACRTAGVKSEELVEAYLSRMDRLSGSKSDEGKMAWGELAKAFASQTSFAEPIGDDMPAWVRKARAWWKERRDEYNPPPPEPPPEDGPK